MATYLPLKFAQQNDSCGIVEIMKMAGLTKELESLTPDGILQYANSPYFYQHQYNGPLKSLNEVLMLNKQISTTFFGDQDPASEWKDVISMWGVVMKWTQNKQVYRFDKEFAEALSETENLKLYPEILRRLPFDTFYLDFEKMNLFKPFDGMFVSVVVEDNDDVTIMGHRLIGDVYYTTTARLKDDVKNYDENGSVYFDYRIDNLIYRKNVPLSNYLKEKMGDKTLSNENFPKIWMFMLQAMCYLSSDKPDVEENETTKITYRKPTRIKNQFREIQKWDVGVRYGAEVRKTKKEQEESYSEVERTPGTHKSPRPHSRCAHWHHYRVGKGREKIIVKWLAPTFVGAKMPLPAVVHRVKAE